MPYFTWKEKGLAQDCTSLAAMAARFEEAASLMRRMATAGFELVHINGTQQISHQDPALFQAYGFINEESPEKQLNLTLETNDNY
jgi:hypothetical protein